MSDSTFYGLLVFATGRTTVPGVLPELHLNIWEKEYFWSSDSAFLDVGLMLDVAETAQTFEFVLPWLVSDKDIEDLAPRLQESGAIPAIFNEGWVCSNSNGSAGYVTDQTSSSIFTFVEMRTDLEVYSHNPGTRNEQQSIRLNVPGIKAKSVSAMSSATRMYVRFRVKKVPKTFYRVSINPKDRIFLSSWQRTEIIDFRMNVRRGVPLGFEQKVNGIFVAFQKVHLFLMKSRDQDIVFEDKRFKSCRSLEDEHFWANYSLSAKSNDWDRFWSRQRVKSSLGYQWTKTIEKNLLGGVDMPVTEFGTLARFKNIQFGIIKFIIIAGLVGALGSMVWDGIKYRYESSMVTPILQGWLARTLEKGASK
ncbi:MAG: hypothetical protein ACOH2B_05430 [Burkholderiaceae bacterium]